MKFQEIRLTQPSQMKTTALQKPTMIPWIRSSHFKKIELSRYISIK